ncbi:MAG: carboxypeptidase regulatory-like domain-containing protein [Acidobacteriota bacterium]
MNTKPIHRAAWAVWMLSLCLPFALAQTETGTIMGIVRDPSDAVVGGCVVTVINVDKGTRRESIADEQGHYRVPLLTPGNYRVVVQQEGFRTVNRSGIILHVDQTVVVDVALELGSLTSEVSVTEDAPLVTTNEPTQAQVIDNQKIVDLPLNGRDYIQLALISAGTNQPPPGGRTGGFAGSGMRPTQNNYLLDGLDNNNNQNTLQAFQAEVVKPSVDAIREFKVMTNSFSAEYGRASGAIISAALKSGSNRLHGTAYEFLRNEKLDAKNFFDLPSQPKPPFKRNQFGFSLGGPILKDKTFFFGDYEGSRIRESRTVNNTIPTPKMVQGDFSELLPQTIIYDPFTYDPVSKTRKPFTNNIIPASMLDPIGVKVASFYPQPNKPGLTQNFLYNPPDREDVDRWDVKLDHTFSSTDTLYGWFSFQRRKNPESPSLPPPAYGGLATAKREQNDGRHLGITYNRVFSASMIMSVKAGWNSIFTAVEPPENRRYNEELGLKGVETSLAGMAMFNVAAVTGVGIGATTPNLAGSQTRQVLADMSRTHGRHSTKFGVNVSWVQQYLSNPGQALGIFNFNDVFTRDPKTLKGGRGIADLLLGTVTGAQVSGWTYQNLRSPFYAFYLQDDWRLGSRLTFNLGLRYELRPPWVETDNGLSNLDYTDPHNPKLVLAKEGSRFDRALVRTDANNFGPRIGFAYQVSRKLVIRSGYGIYYGNTAWYAGLATNPPFRYGVALSTDSVHPTILLHEGLPEGIVKAENAANIALQVQERQGHLPYSQQWSLSVQREFPGDLLFDIGYYANVAHKLTRLTDENWALPGPGDINARRRWTSIFVPGDNVVVSPLSTFSIGHREGNSNFHSLQARMEKRLSHGLSFLTSYMWSKTIGDSNEGASTGFTADYNPQNPRDFRAERGLADEHRAHRFVTSYVYELPFGTGKTYLADMHPVVNSILGGWSCAGIAVLSSGRPVNLGVMGNPSNTGMPDRPNVLKDWRLSKEERSIDRWFDTTAFVANAPYTYGNAARNLLEGPGSVNFDFALYKDFRITNERRLQVRVEAFNLFNTPQFGAPNAIVGNSNFGKISSIDGRPRNLQIGLKFIF